MKVDIVCPVYKEFEKVKALYQSLFLQKGIDIASIVFPYTLSGNKELDQKFINFFNENNIKYFILNSDEFSHSLTREKAIKEFCQSKIVVMISQDIKFINNDSIYQLCLSIENQESVYNYGRQIGKKRTIEKYIREKNYPSVSRVVSKNDIPELQIMSFFSSDSFSAYNRDIFIKLNGYQGYDVMMNEDQLYSKIILDAGYKKKYCAEAIVEHSHKYTLKKLYQRYFQAGQFYKKVKVFDQYKKNESGFSLAFYVLKRAFMEFNIPVIIRWLPDMASRYLGLRKGQRED